MMDKSRAGEMNFVLSAITTLGVEKYQQIVQEHNERVAKGGVDYKAAWARIERALEYGKPNPRMMTVHPWFRGW